MTWILWALLVPAAGAGGNTVGDLAVAIRLLAHLAARPLLRELGGAEVIADGGGRRQFVLGVGKAVMKGAFDEDVERALKAAAFRARAAVVGEIDGRRVAVRTWAEERGAGRRDKDGDQTEGSGTAVREYRENVRGWAAGLRTVHVWRSADGRMVYVALGGLDP